MTVEELRKLDVKVHEKIMGIACYEPSPDLWVFDSEGAAFPGFGSKKQRNEVPFYSSDMRAAWLVVEKLSGEEYVLVRCDSSHFRGEWCTIRCSYDASPETLVKRDVFGQSAETMPLAICLAALQAVEATDVSGVCCDADGNTMIFIGLRGEGVRQSMIDREIEHLRRHAG